LLLVTLENLRARVLAAPHVQLDHSFPPDGDDMRDLPQGHFVPAAVLVPFVLGRVPGVLLTKRTAHLNNHAGQVSFPGGRIDPEDSSPEAAALREAQEEIGLDPASVELVGRLPDYITGTGYRITPVLGLLTSGMGLDGLGLSLSPHEVDSVFELTLPVLLDPNAPQRKAMHWRGRMREYWEWPHPEHHIWGATAAILVGLAARLRQAG
jgi:8-oxo-dGTP pyrophosphatase MutT (NUDIX family)